MTTARIAHVEVFVFAVAVLAGPKLDPDTTLADDVGGAGDVERVVEPVRDVMGPSALSGIVPDEAEIMRLLRVGDLAEERVRVGRELRALHEPRAEGLCVERDIVIDHAGSERNVVDLARRST